MFKCGNEPEQITRTSYKINHLLAHSIKLYLNGKIMKQAISMFVEECCSNSIQLKAKKLQLSNGTVTQCTECI